MSPWPTGFGDRGRPRHAPPVRRPGDHRVGASMRRPYSSIAADATRVTHASPLPADRQARCRRDFGAHPRSHIFLPMPDAVIDLFYQRPPRAGIGRYSYVAARPAARAAGADRHQEGMQSGRVRCVHDPARRRRVNSCLTLAVMHAGARITTIEGLTKGDTLHPLQAAFIEHEAFQCGYCTAGQIMSGVACIAEGHAESPEEIRTWMSGNICRCGAYVGIVGAVADGGAHGATMNPVHVPYRRRRSRTRWPAPWRADATSPVAPH